MDFAKQIFKAYDIRGIVKNQLTPEVVQKIGAVLGTMALEKKLSSLVTGCDGRLSSPELLARLNQGILSSGCNVLDIGQVTTPMVYFANYELKTYSGVMVTGSHNPPEYNGLKMVLGGATLAGEDIQTIYTRLCRNSYVTDKSANYKALDISEAYLNKITSDVKLSRSMNLMIDCGNGAAGDIAPKLFRRMGAKVLGLFCEVDGNFPNHHPDPSQPANLVELTQALATSNCEIGFAFDGDGDRLGVVTKDGNIIYPDRQMMLFAADVLAKNPKAKIIFDVKSSDLLANWIKDHGGDGVLCRTGHSFIKAEIAKTKALLAGEMSGHIFFNDRWYGVDDGVYAGARLLEILSQVDDPSELLNSLPNSIATPEININVAEGKQHEVMAKLAKTAKFKTSTQVITIDGLRVSYKDGFGLVRASNTTSVLVLRFESNSHKGLNRIQQEFEDVLKPYIKNIKLKS